VQHRRAAAVAEADPAELDQGCGRDAQPGIQYAAGVVVAYGKMMKRFTPASTHALYDPTRSLPSTER
jgi:hypothetical protein